MRKLSGRDVRGNISLLRDLGGGVAEQMTNVSRWDGAGIKILEVGGAKRP